MAEELALDAADLSTSIPADMVETPQEPAEVAETAAPAVEIEGDGRTLPKWVKALQPTDPEGYKQARETFFAKTKMDERLKDFDLDGVKGWLDQEGGRDSISERLADLSSKAEELDSLHALAESGDAALLDRIPAESLTKLAPAVLERYAQADPEGWQRDLSTVFAATIQNSGVNALLDRMGMMLRYNDTENLGAEIQRLSQWFGSFQQSASQPRAKKPSTQQESWKAEKSNWEAKQFEDKLNTSIEDFRKGEIGKQIEQYVARDPKNADKQQAVMDLIRTKVIERMNADKDFQGKLQSFLQKRDQDGAFRLIKSRETRAIQEIAPQQGRIIYGQPTQAKTVEVTKPVVTQTTVRRPANAPMTKEEKLAAMFA